MRIARDGMRRGGMLAKVHLTHPRPRPASLAAGTQTDDE